MATTRFLDGSGIRPHHSLGAAAASVSPASAKGVKVFALWRHSLDEARDLARQYLQKKNRVVFAQLVNAPRLQSEEMRSLWELGISVVPVSSRYKNNFDDDGELLETVLAGLRAEKHLLELADKTEAPDVDAAAAAAVAEMYNKFPKNVTPAQRREFLDEFYGADDADDGVR